MIRIHLAEGEAQRLEQAFRTTTDPKLRDRLQIVRLAHRGRAHRAIAEDLAMTPRSVQRWLNAFLDRGLDGLRPRKAPGAKSKVPDELAEEVRRWVIDGPAKQGLDRANWTYAELADHLLKVKGIHASRSAMQRFCSKLGVRVYRPTYRYLRGNPDKQAKAREEIAELKLEHRPQAGVARELGLKEGTLWSRLARARELLQRRLSRRGIDLTAVLAAAAVAGAARAAVPVELVAATIRAAGAAGAGAVSAEVAALVKGGLKAMSIRAKVGVLLALTTGLLTAGAGVTAFRVPAVKEPAAPGSPAPEGGPARTEGPAQVRTDRFGDPLPPGAFARLGTVRFRQGGALAFLPDGRSLIAGGFGNTRFVRIWEVPGGKEQRRIGEQPAPGWIQSIALSPDGAILATASWGRDGYGVRLWDGATAKEVRRIEVLPGLGEGLAFSPNGQVLAVAGAGKVRLFEAATARFLREFGPGEQLRTVAFSPDGKLVVTGGYGRSVHLWKAATGKQVRPLEHGAEIHAVVFSPDGATLAGAGEDGTIRLWTTATGKQVRQLAGHCGAALCVAFSPDGKTLASGSRGSEIHLWETATGRELRRLEGHQGPVRSLVFSPDGATLASESEDFTIRLWEPASGRELTRTAGHQGQVNAVAFSPDGKTLASGAFCDRTLRLWDPATGAELRGFRGHRHGVLSVAFSPDGKLLASGGAENDSTVRLWEAATGKERHVLAGKGRVERLAFAPDGRLLASADWGGLHLWDPATGRPLRDLGRQDYGAFAFSPDGKALAAVHQESLYVWEAATGRESRRFRELPRGTCTIAFSPDGRLLATGGYGEDPEEGKRGRGAGRSYERTLCLWDVAGGRELRRLKGPEESVRAVAFSPDGRTLAAGTDNGAVYLWEVLTAKLRLRLAGQRNTVVALAFSPDGRRLASGSYDSTILVWSALGPTASAKGPLAGLWQDLAGTDAGKAFQAVGMLAADPGKAVLFLGERLGQLPAPDAAKTQRLIADRESEEFAVRERASGELERFGERAEPALRQARARGPSPEARRRIESLLAKLDAAEPSPETLRAVRAVEALEHAGTPEARQLLRKLADGAPDARLTHEAKAALDRLAR